jgi:proteasome accessory factor B
VAKKKPDRETSARDDRSKRLLDLVVMLLAARAPVSYREIRAMFKAYRTEHEEAGLRAFERDKADLLELGVPIRYIQPEDDEAAEDTGYVVDLRRYRMPVVHLTPQEAAALVLAGSVARAAPGTTYDEVVDLALKKLAFDAPPPPDAPGTPGARREPVLVHYPKPADAQALAERLAQLEQAIANRKRVTFGYVRAATGAEGRRDVDPYGLFYRLSWYLVGFCHARQGVRSFRLDRMTDLVVAPKPKSPDFERPARFDVRDYAARSPWRFDADATPVEVELEVHPAAAALLDEDLGEATREPQDDGVVRVRFQCANSEYVVSRVLGAKGAVVLRAPASLRARVREELAALEARHE